MATKTEDLRLVISQDFEKKYSKCQAKSCVKTEQFYQLVFYKDNHCMIATLEDYNGEVYGRVILWNNFYFRPYVKKGYQRAFTTWLKRVGMEKGNDLYITYPIQTIRYMPYVDGMRYFNTQFDYICNKNTQDFFFGRSWETDANIKLLQALYYYCPECDCDTNIRVLPVNENGRIYCPRCHYRKEDDVASRLFEGIDTIDWQDGFKGDIPYKELKSGIENSIYKPIIEGKYTKITFDKLNPKGVYK